MRLDTPAPKLRKPIPPDAASISRHGAESCAAPSMRARFALEAGVIARLMREAGLVHYVDLGCWYGLLLREVIARVDFGPGSVIAAVDAVPAVLEFARAETVRARPDAAVRWIAGAVLPRALASAPPPIRIHAWDTSRSGLFASEGVVVRGVPFLSVREVLVRAFAENDPTRLLDAVAKSYIKMDLEGCDEGIALDLLDAGFRPGVLHLEATERRYAESEIVRTLRAHGYATPAQFGLHSLYSLACPRRDTGLPAAAIAFGPDAVYWDSASNGPHARRESA